MTSQVHAESGWFSVKEACEILDVSRRTIYNWINNEKISSKTENKHRFVWLHFNEDSKVNVSSENTYTNTHTDAYTEHTDSHADVQFNDKMVDTLQKDLEYFKSKCDKLEDQIADQSKRHDAVVLRLSGTIESQQLQLAEANTLTFWQRLFGFR